MLSRRILYALPFLSSTVLLYNGRKRDEVRRGASAPLSRGALTRSLRTQRYEGRRRGRAPSENSSHNGAGLD